MILMNSSVHSWVTFIGVILLLLGIFGLTRTFINLLAFEKYPTAGVINISFIDGAPGYNVRESDCFFIPTPTYDPSGNPIFDSNDPQSQLQQENCLKGQEEDRKNAKANDFSKSVLFLFLGLGTLVTTKFLFKPVAQ